MSMLLIVEELGRTLRQEIARKFATHPRASLGVALVAGLVAVVVTWSAISALLWPPTRNAYGSVSGTVTSVSGSPVADAVVLFVNDAAGSGASAQTDARGNFTTRGIRAGRYAVAIQPTAADSGSTKKAKHGKSIVTKKIRFVNSRARTE